MGFVLDGLDSEAYDRNYTDRDLIRRIAAYFGRGQRGADHRRQRD